jgi:hypothetical protein
LEEYAREIFPLEERANGLTWMLEEDDGGGGGNENAGQHQAAGDEDSDDDEDEGLVMRGLKRDEEEWLA